MKENTYISAHGIQTTNYIIDNINDSFVVQEIIPYEDKYGQKYSIKTPEGIVIRLTGGQSKFFSKNKNIQPGTKILARQYTNNFGTFLGLKFADEKQASPVNTNTNTSATASLPNLGTQPVTQKPAAVPGLTENDNLVINQLVSCADYAPWKEYAKVSVHQFKEAFLGVAEKMNIQADISGGKSAIAYNVFFSKV